MLNDRNEPQDEESEYHFTEDQVTYDTETEGQTKTAPSNLKNLAIEKVSQHKAIIIGTVIFIILMFIVYKMMAPTPAAPDIQFSSVVTSPKTAPAVPTKAAAPPAAPPASIQAAAPVQPMQAPAAPVPPAAPQAIPAASAVPMEIPNPLSAPAPASAVSSPTAGIPSAAPQPPQEMAVQPAPAPPAAVAAASVVADKIAALEDQNSKLMSLLQSDYAQKLSEQQAQNAALQNKLQELNGRIAVLEANLARASAVSVSRPAPPPPAMVPVIPVKALGPRMVYTVQAIIPGRAWLKSDSGDTITVAEGDSLRGIGRITKIDPYDGVVQIDTGSRIITLSYGNNSE